MMWADWGDNVVRTRFVEVHDFGNGYLHEIEAPVRIIGFAGGLSGPFFEPIDGLTRMELPGDSATVHTSQRYHKKCQYTLPIKALNELVEDNKNGEEAPTPLHSFSGPWLD